MYLKPPVRDFSSSYSISQLFGVNAKTYSKFNLPGHNALDIVVSDSKLGFGTPILAAHDGVVESMTYDVPHITRGNGLYILSHDNKFSTNYWHLSAFDVKVGQNVKAGQVIALMGNSGFVFPRPSPVCPHCGTHVHFGLKIHGKNNEYKGFVDPIPHMIGLGDKLPIYFNRNLYQGRSGDDVSWLQTILRLEGFAEDYDPIGYFGNKTRRDVSKLQVKYGIIPILGYFGSKTRDLVTKRWSSYYKNK